MTTPDNTTSIDTAIAEGGSYELLKRRLMQHGEALASKVQTLNEARVSAFGKTDLHLKARLRARTENNCVARDIVRVGDTLLFGYNVFMGLRKDIQVADVFGLYRLNEAEGADELVPVDPANSFLSDPRFVLDFRELYTYYKHATLTRLRVNQQKLLAAFQIGQTVNDLRVFRWSIENDGSVKYIDNRGERDIALPPAHDFEWVVTGRDEHVNGKYPHVNILDTIFVETLGGDLTVKIENNTESGLGIYSEPVMDQNQALVDADVQYVKLGSLILLKIKPYREDEYRYLVYNHRTQQVARIDAIGRSCVQLPEDHGIIFPGGYYLQSGENKRFDMAGDTDTGFRFKRSVRSPNGEDVLYLFYSPVSGRYGLFTYNLINRTLGTPLLANGYARFEDGRVLVFQSENSDPTRNHPMQLWQTPFSEDEHAARQVDQHSFFGRIGNAELVRGVADLMEICRAVREQVATRVVYEDLIRLCGRILDAYYWLDSDESGQANQAVQTIVDTARATLDEFDKVAALRRDAGRQLEQAEAALRALLTDIASKLWQHPQDFVDALDRLRRQRGNLLALKDQRYIDSARIDHLDLQLSEEQARIGEKALSFLGTEKSFVPYHEALAKTAAEIDKAAQTAALDAALKSLDQTGAGLDLLNELIGGLPGGDAVARTTILEQVSTVYSEVNRLRAAARNRRKGLSSLELGAEFGAQFKLFGQAVESALERTDTPDQCDDALTRLLAQIEELEGRFGEDERFAADLAEKREAVYEAMVAKKQQLLEVRQRRQQNLAESAKRILSSVPRRVQNFREASEVHAYFAGDALIAKCRNLIEELRSIGAQVLADDLDTQLKTARDQALRVVRDRGELMAEDGNTIRLGRHAFTVGKQALDLAIVPSEQGLAWHLTGTDYLQTLINPDTEALSAFWSQALVSESPNLYRAEYLAGCMLESALTNREEWQALQAMITDSEATADTLPEALLTQVRSFAAPRYQEGYQKGIHDFDAATLLHALLRMEAEAALLRYGPRARVLAMLYWQQGVPAIEYANLQRQAASAAQIRELFGNDEARQTLIAEWKVWLLAFAQREKMIELWGVGLELASEAAAYLSDELAHKAAGNATWIASGAALDLADSFTRTLERQGKLSNWRTQLLDCVPLVSWRIARDWMYAYVAQHEPEQADWIDEAAALLTLNLPQQRLNARLGMRLQGLRGEHPRLVGGGIWLNLNDFHQRFQAHSQNIVPGFQQWQALRQRLLDEEKARLHLEQFQAKPLSSFVRNQLISDVYLPLVGDNLAKQIGTAGENSRTDRMGMLLLISPPGYGKTTLMEYLADRLGLVFVRINCPALGHQVTALDPGNAPHSAAAQELEKLNLGLAMGNNVMLYLDDIQHTNPEFLQKFIALCDGTRRIEGVWQGQPKTYDLRGKRFAVVMAGNPYTESGEVFKIPDMLANRSDIYNLGDVLSGREGLFALSYLENSLTFNPALMPLATREPKDVGLLVRLAAGEEVAMDAFSYQYSAAELNELTAILQRLFTVRDVLLKVNAAYIASAAQDDDYRTEPPFKLQGSYRNMAKLAAKVNALMNADDLDALIRDHYRGEAQTLTAGAEENMLRLAAIIGRPTEDEKARWTTICGNYQRLKKLGGAEGDGAVKVANLLADISVTLDAMLAQQKVPQADGPNWEGELASLRKTLAGLKTEVNVHVPESEALAAAVKRMADTYEQGIAPLVTASYHKLRLDHSVWEQVREMAKELKKLDGLLSSCSQQPASKPRKKGETNE